MGFKAYPPKTFNDNLFSTIDDQWLLICTKDEDNARINMMTASWGGFGILWNKEVCFLFVRPQRHTHKLMGENDRFSVCVLPESQREALRICGRESGRTVDKIARTGLTPITMEGVPALAEAESVFVLRQLYVDQLKKENFIDNSFWGLYPSDDFHTVYICEIEKILKKE